MTTKNFLIGLVALTCIFSSLKTWAQSKPDKELKMNLNEDGSHYLKMNFTAQIWARYNQSNPGTTVFGYAKPETYDIGLRRVRTQLYGKVSDKVFLYTQFGINNFNNISARKSPLFFHDVVAEYYITPKTLQMGMGLTAWTGFSRFSSPSVAGIMGYDAPLFAQSTNDANDQFLRKLSIYAKGKLGKFDYRLILSDPFAVQTSSAVKPISTTSDFSYMPAKLQSGGYLMYQFLDQESNLTPYMTGGYLGKKKIFNLGAGVQYQRNAMWHWTDTFSKSIVQENMLHYAIDAFYDHPIGTKGSAISAYATYMHMGFGKNYIRNIGPMNPADGTIAGTATVNGAGSGFPSIGTGNIIYAQVGYLLPKNILGENIGQLQPYIMMTHGNFQRLNGAMNEFDAGLNWYIDGSKSKLSLNYQNRPVFSNTDFKEVARRNLVVLQFQIAI
ncbi:MAG: hypothetical protein HYZ42_07190 [Bacteroidetes bacterium]|nr:hypothetical protein [Bacteroidota bacterium]